jgi:FkbM family methyltransferase
MIKQTLISLRRSLLLASRNLRGPAVVNHAGVRMAVGDHLSPTVRKFLYAGDYEKSELRAIRDHLEADDVVMEVGTGLGFISLQCARRIGADRVHTFEANADLEPHIRRNYELNGLRPSLAICLLSDRAGEADFYVEPDFWASSTVRRNETSAVRKVAMRSLNDEVRRIRPTFLILDIEGGEYDLLRILEDFLTIKKVSIELHEDVIGPEKIEEIRRRLVDAGFAIDPQYSVDCQLFARKLDAPKTAISAV